MKYSTQSHTRARAAIWCTALALSVCTFFGAAPRAAAANGGLVGANIQDGQLLGYYGNGGDIVIPNIVTTIAPEAFMGNDNVTSVTIPGSVSTIGYDAFNGCTALESIRFSEPKNGAKMAIRVSAFVNCPKLSECIIPACAEYVTGNVFKNCPSMEAIQVDPDNPYYFTDADGALFGPWVDEGVPQYGDSNLTLTAYPCGRKDPSYTIPQQVHGRTVNRLWASSFRTAHNLRQVNIPATCTIIGSDAFEDTGLTSLTIPSTVEYLGVSVAARCKNLTEVDIQAPITELGLDFFEGCTSLQRVKYPTTLRVLGDECFAGCTSLTNMAIPDHVSSIGIDAFLNCSNLQRVFIPASVQHFPSLDGVVFNPFKGASPDLVVYVVKGSVGERWAINHAQEFGWTYQVINGSHELPALDAGTFSLVDIGHKVKLTGAFQLPTTMHVSPVTGGSAYEAFRAAAGTGALSVFDVALDSGVRVPETMTLGVGRPAGMTADAKLYEYSSGTVKALPASSVSGTLTAAVDHLGCFAVIDGTVEGGDQPTVPETPTSVTLNRTTASLEEGKSLMLSATVLPATAKDKSVTWTSSAPLVASVDKGVVTALKSGSAVITATTVNGLKASCTVTVTSSDKPEPPVPPTPTPTPVTGIETSAALRAGNGLTSREQAPFALNFSGASRVATVQVSFETTGSAVEVVGRNGFTLLGEVDGKLVNGTYTGTAMLCYLNPERQLFSCTDECTVAELLVTGNKPTTKITGITISGWDADQTVAYGVVKGIDPSQATFTGEKTYDLNGDGVVDQLDITFAQMYYRAERTDANWEQAKRCDFNDDGLVDIADFVDVFRHFTVR